MQSFDELIIGSHSQYPIGQLRINRGSPDSCLAKFVDVFPSNDCDYDVLFGVTDEKDISLHSILCYLVSVNEKVDDIRSYMNLQFLDEKIPSDLGKLIIKYM